MERLDKLIANSSTLSRSEAHKLIKSGAVKVNGIAVRDKGYCLDPDNSEITLNGAPFFIRKYVYIMLNKPEGVVSAARDDREKTVIDLVPDEYKKKNLFPAGRLDRNTTGFVLITDDGDFAHSILSPKNHIEKTYEARLAEPLSDEAIKQISNGITLGDSTKCLPAKVRIIQEGKNPLVEVIICEGKYHQIKRMFAAAGNSVTELKRVKMGNLHLDRSLAPGECRLISQKEKNLIQKNNL